MFRRLFGRRKQESHDGPIVIARLLDRAQPLDRGALYEDPLQEMLVQRGWGEVSGGGTQQGASGEIEFCDIEIQVAALSDEILNGLIAKLEELGAPRGSELLCPPPFSNRPFGAAEGLAVYLNGTDLPDSTYRECDSNFVYSEFNRLLEGIGKVHSHWQGPTETALYLYGSSFEAMRSAIESFLASYPLCERARVVRVA